MHNKSNSSICSLYFLQLCFYLYVTFSSPVVQCLIGYRDDTDQPCFHMHISGELNEKKLVGVCVILTRGWYWPPLYISGELSEKSWW